MKLRMKIRNYLVLILMMMAGYASAAWQAIEEDRGYYFDPSSVQTQGQRVKVWGLQNYETALPLGNSFTLSKRIMIEADCLQTQFRTVSFAFMTEQMGEGEMIAGYPLTQGTPFSRWRSPMPNSFELALFNQVCRKPATPPPPAVAPNESIEVIDEKEAPNSV